MLRAMLRYDAASSFDLRWQPEHGERGRWSQHACILWLAELWWCVHGGVPYGIAQCVIACLLVLPAGGIEVA